MFQEIDIVAMSRVCGGELNNPSDAYPFRNPSPLLAKNHQILDCVQQKLKAHKPAGFSHALRGLGGFPGLPKSWKDKGDRYDAALMATAEAETSKTVAAIAECMAQ